MGLRWFVTSMVTAGFILAFTTASAAASDRDDVLASIQQFFGGLNKGDVKTAVAACASPASIVDDFAPHEWHGTNACADWAVGFAADNAKHGITDGIVTLFKPWHVYVKGDYAYVVVPANFAFKQHGKPALESGSIFTAALKKFAAGWRITGWAWADH